MLCEVDRSYIEDGFNLYGLRHHVPNFQECLDIILDKTAAEECRDPKVTRLHNCFLNVYVNLINLSALAFYTTFSADRWLRLHLLHTVSTCVC
jgi:Casein kinase II regulatory subunit